MSNSLWTLIIQILISYSCYFIKYAGTNCANYSGIPMKRSNHSISDHYNPSVCCPESCGSNCNDCYNAGAIASDNCYRNQKHMCDQGQGGRSKCCAPDIPRNRLCSKMNPAPCRLGTSLIQYHHGAL